MNDFYTDRSEYAFSTWTYEVCGLEEALKDIAAHGFTIVELWGDTVHFDPRRGFDRRLAKQWLRDLGLKVHSVHSPFRNYLGHQHDEEFRKYRMKILKETINDCSDFSVPVMVVHGLDRHEYNYMYDTLQILRDDLAELCEYGQKRGVMPALENLVGSRHPMEIRCRLEDHVENFSGIGLKYCLDIGHAMLNGADLFHEVDVCGDDLITFHIHNNDGQRDIHEMPDQGVINWPVLHDYIRQKGFKGPFVLELFGGLNPFALMEKVDALFR
jgi:sugar phosphate isomerase/epimerase